MKPYYQDKYATIYHGDSREIIPHLNQKFDLLLTDPPYGIGADNRKKILSRANLASAKDYGESNWDSAPPSKELIDLIRSICDKQIIWGGNYFELPPSSQWLFWDKLNGDNDFADGELAWTNLGGAVRRRAHLWNGMLRKDNETREHPTQKPIGIILWCMSLAKDFGTVFDPFMGSGTTLRAAKDLLKQSVGIELEERYCEIAAKRLSQEVLEF